MKHTFIFLDKLIRLIKYQASLQKDSLKTVEGRGKNLTKLRNINNLIEEYVLIIRKLMDCHKTHRNLTKLHKVHEREIGSWVYQVEATFKQIDKLIDGIDSDVQKVKKILENHPLNINKLQAAVADISYGTYINKLQCEESQLQRLRKIDIFKVQQLKKIINHEYHHKGLLKWVGFIHLTPHEQEIKREKYFVELLNL